MKEETGLDAGNAEGGYLFTYKRENPGEGDNYFVDVYRFVMDIDDKDLHLQTEETDATCLQRQTRSGSLQSRESSYIMTALSRRLKCDCVSRRKTSKI